MVSGWVAPGFEGVQAAFAENFASRGELGAAFAVSLEGKPIVDLWGGVADVCTGRPWSQDTLQVIFSGTKAFVALCLLMLVDRGALDLEAPVCRYWPEFGAAGKDEVLVGELASHQARLPGIQSKVLERDIVDDRRMAALLAAQPQDRDPRARDVYHALTFGWLCGELIRRVDGRSVGRFFADEVAAPLGLEAWIGLPADLEPRVSVLRYAENWGQLSLVDPDSLAEDDLLARVWNNPALFPPDRMPWNWPELHRAEIAGAGGIATARSMARFYGCLAAGGTIDGVTLLSAQTLELGRKERTRRIEPLLDEPQAFGVGFQLQTERGVFGAPADAFGHAGAGGSVHCAWPSQKLGISYAMNTMRDDESVDPRPQALLAALRESVG